MCCVVAGCGPAALEDSSKELMVAMEKVRPLHKTLGTPGIADWLAHHDEPGQTFSEYLQCSPTLPRGQRRVIYIQPLGEFTKSQRRIITLTVDFMACYFNLTVKVNAEIPLSVIPAGARRKHPEWGMDQILSGYVLRNILKPRLPADAAAVIAFTTSDLWPGRGWNFVFGEASIRERVAVWSIYRNGNPDESEDAFRLCLMRTIKTAVHETGHMFSMLHCIKYECCMCGSNHRAESDSHPLYLGPECMAKICWATDTDPVDRYSRLAAFCDENGFVEERDFFRKSIEALGGDPTAAE
jgi:archaemetzincin